MEAQKINLLNNSSNKESKFATKKMVCYRQQKQKVNTFKTILLNLRQKILNQVFVIILMHLF